MDPICWALLGGYPVMGAAIAVLFRAYQKSQEARLRDLQEHKRTIEGIHEALKRRTAS